MQQIVGVEELNPLAGGSRNGGVAGVVSTAMFGADDVDSFTETRERIKRAIGRSVIDNDQFLDAMLVQHALRLVWGRRHAVGPWRAYLAIIDAP